jgi:site-specific recombinase XerD
MRDYLEEFLRELKNRNYAKNTIRAYTGHLKQFLTFSRESKLEPRERIAVFLENKNGSVEQKKLAWVALNCSIKLLYIKSVRTYWTG